MSVVLTRVVHVLGVRGGGNTRVLGLFNDVIGGLDTVPQQNSGGGGGGGVGWAATGRSTTAGGGGGEPVDEELKDAILEEFGNKLFYAEDEVNEDFADAEDADEGDDEEVFEDEQKTDGPTVSYFHDAWYDFH